MIRGEVQVSVEVPLFLECLIVQYVCVVKVVLFVDGHVKEVDGGWGVLVSVGM